jgi:hypothetical protein
MSMSTPDPQSSYDPYWDVGAKKIKNEAERQGNWLGRSHYPDAVVDDLVELKSLAQRVCKTWWNRLQKVDRQFDYAEVERIYTGNFIAGYTEGVDAETPHEVKEARKKVLAQTGGATVAVKNARYYDDRAIYELELHDSLYLTTADKTTAFEVHFNRDGDIVQSEVAEQ